MRVDSVLWFLIYFMDISYSTENFLTSAWHQLPKSIIISLSI